MHRVATGEELRRLVESRYDDEATPAYVAPVRHLAGDLVWQGDVHVFDLVRHRTEAFAWGCPFDGELHTALRSTLIPGPSEAVRSVLTERG